MDTCIAIIMYCLRLFLLFTIKKICSGDLPAKNICLHAKFQVWWCYGFGSTALQQDLEEEEEEEEDKEHELYFPDVMSKYIYFC